jgi:chromosome partitioning protein
MPTVVFASPKGGAGKSTSAVVLATELAQRGAAVTVIDADPNHPVSQWARRPGCPETLTVIRDVSEESIIDTIEAASARTTFVVVDLEGTASMTVAYAISRADLVVIPVQGSQLDATEAAKAIRLIRQQEKAFVRRIPYAVLFTRTSAAIKPRTFQHIRSEFSDHGVPAFQTQMHERDAFRALFSFGGTLESLDPMQVSNVEAAVSNARAFAGEVIAKLRQETPQTKAAEVA